MYRLVRAFVLFAFVLSLAFPLLAQTEPQPAPAPQPATPEQKKSAEEEKKPRVAEEVTVTARKKEETVQEVPMSVAAPSESELRDRGAETIEDIAANVAGFTVQNLGPGQSQVAMRGVSSGQIVRDQPGVKEQVGVYLDESVISLSLFTPDVDLFDLNRVEVLRGPQGTLFGSGSESGTVRYITNQPKLGTNETVAEFTADDVLDGGPGGSIKAAVNAPLGATSAMRFVGYVTRYGGFMDAVQPDLHVKHNVNDGDRYGGRFTFLFKPSDALTITPRIMYQDVKMNGWNRIDVYNILGNPFTTTRPAVQLGDHRQFTQIGEPYSDKFTLADVNVSYNFAGKTLTSITSYDNRNILVTRDAGALTSSITGGSIGLPQNVYTLNAPLLDRTRAHVLTQEVRLADTTPVFEWVTGAYYSHINRHYSQDLPVTGFSALTGIPTKGLDAPTDSLFWSNLDYHFHQEALFGEGTWKVTPKFDLTGGLRFYNYHESRSQVFDGIFGNDNNGTSLVEQPGSTKAHGFAPRAIAAYKMSDTQRFYAQVSKGFRLGGINDPLNVPLCTPQDLAIYQGHDSWKDETLWNYEVGSKTTLAGGRGSLNVAGFYADIKNLQATVTAGSCSSRLIFNVPSSRSTGAEVEFEMAPSNAFDFALSASHNDSKLRSTLADSAGNVVAGIKSGNRLPTVPENQAAAAATFHWTMSGNLAGYATGVYQYVGDRYTQIGDQAVGFGVVNLLSFNPHNIGGPYTQNTFTFNPLLPSYNLVNVRVGALKGKWDTSVFVNNLTNTRAFLALDQERGTRARVGYLTNQPRTVGVSARATF